MNKTWSIITAGTLLFISSVKASAEDVDLTHDYHPMTLNSKVLNETRKVIVRLPDSYDDNPNKKYPVIYRVDGPGNLAMLSSVMERLEIETSTPEVIIVAIANTDRTRDLAPTVNQDPRGPVGQGGGADKFLDFIEHELMPKIDKTYRTHDFKVISGASIGGLLAIHSLQSRPHLFQAHVAYSPAVWWGARETVKSTKDFIKQSKKLDNYLYMNIGEEGGEMRQVYDDFANFVQANEVEGLKVKIDTFNDVSHNLTQVAGAFNAYKNMFLPLAMPKSVYTGDTQSILDYYQQVSAQRGEEIAPVEWVIRYMGYHYMNENKMAEAIKLFKFNISVNSQMAESYNALAYALEEDKQYEEALKQVNLALQYAKTSEPGYHYFVERKDRLEAALN